jgi:HK97 family phage prohead protease
MGAKSRLNFGDTSPENSLMHSAIAAQKPDFSGWATKANLLCSDGRTILPGAFAHQDKAKVPLVWQHGHDDPDNVLGHTILENRDEGVYCYGYFNGTPKGSSAKELVKHNDIDSLSIFANKLVEKAKQVSHGIIREVSLVMARANPGALIDNIELQHSDGTTVIIDDEAVIYTGEQLEHADAPAKEEPEVEGPSVEQKEAVHYMVGAGIEAATEQVDDKTTATHSALGGNEKESGRTMKRNVFEQENPTKPEGAARRTISHDDLKGIVADANRRGSLRDAFQEYALSHGIDNLDVLFPDAQAITNTPEFDKRRTEWVASVINGTKHVPFSRIKSLVADITVEEARARGYVKGNFKKEEFFALTKRATTPTTVYKKQKLDRDDIIDITDIDVVAWLKGEMRLMLDEEIAAAILIGDGRALDDDDKIKDPQAATEGAGIRSILHDHDLYAAKVDIPWSEDTATNSQIVDSIVSELALYKGSGTPTFYTTLGTVTRLLLTRDTLGRRLYRTVSELAAELGVDRIVNVDILDREPNCIGILVNLVDFACGTDRGGDVAMFDDFDIDYNQYKYLIETRLSGALTKIRSAIVFRKVDSALTLVTPVAPTFDPATGDIVVPAVTGVSYRRADTDAVVTNSTITLAVGESLSIYAVPTAGNYFANSDNTEWGFTRRGPLTGRDAGQSNL